MNNEREEVHVGDIGTSLELEIVEDGVVIDISLATGLKMRFQKPSGTTLEKTASFLTDGTDGIITYVTQASDLDESGLWTRQGAFVLGAWNGHTDKVRFQVWPNIAAP